MLRKPILMSSLCQQRQCLAFLASQVQSFSTQKCLRAQKSETTSKSDLILISNTNGVTTMTMNNPEKLNGWTQDMLLSLKDAFNFLTNDSNTKVGILTGKGSYYCAGVNLNAAIKLMYPKKLHKLIAEHNSEVFNTFIEFPKPLIIAANGPAIGACVTSATLSDAIIASEKATFSTPFGKLGVPPEGCSSIHFERIMSKENAKRLLKENWAPTASEAKEIGLIDEVVPHDKLMQRAQALGEEWVKSGQKKRLFSDPAKITEYKNANARESVGVADAFLSYPFLDTQYRFLKSKGKGTANLFWVLKTSRPIWKLML